MLVILIPNWLKTKSAFLNKILFEDNKKIVSITNILFTNKEDETLLKIWEKAIGEFFFFFEFILEFPAEDAKITFPELSVIVKNILFSPFLIKQWKCFFLYNLINPIFEVNVRGLNLNLKVSKFLNVNELKKKILLIEL